MMRFDFRRYGTASAAARPLVIALAALVLLVLGATGVRAAVSFEVDRSTLNEVLAELTLDEVVVPIAGRSLAVRLEDLEVTGLDPTAGEHGQILTSVKLLIPDLGLNIPTTPRISLNVKEHKEGSLLELRFEEVKFSIPLAGTVNVAPLLPPLRYPTDSVWLLTGTRGDVPITSKLQRVEMGTTAIRFVFDVKVQQPGEEPAPQPGSGIRFDEPSPSEGGS